MITLEPILEHMKATEKLKNDIDIPMRALEVTDGFKLKNDTYGSFDISDATLSKLCSMYKFSKPHIQTLADENRYDLIAAQFNHFLSKDEKQKKLRTVGNRVKGIVPTTYKTFDDYDVFSMVNDYLKDNKLDYDLQIINKDDEFTRFRFTFMDTAKSMGVAFENGIDNDMVKGGFEITNSEIGSKMGLNSLVYRQVCSNGMMGWIGDEDAAEIFYKRGNDFNPFSRKNVLEMGMVKCIDQSRSSIELFQKTKSINVKDPIKEIEKIGNRHSLGRGRIEGIQEQFQHEPQNNYYGVLNSYTRYGKEIGDSDYKTRSKMEYIANDTLERVTV